MSVKCLPVVATLSGRGERELSESMLRHVERCDVCTERVASHRFIADGMAELRSTDMTAPAEILPRVMSEIGPWAVEPVTVGRDRRVPVAAAAAVATAAAGTAVLLKLYRQRAA